MFPIYNIGKTYGDHQLRSRHVPATAVDSVCIRTCKIYSERRGGRQLLVVNQVRNSRGPRCPVLNRRLYRICRTAMSTSGRITSRCGDEYSVRPENGTTFALEAQTDQRQLAGGRDLHPHAVCFPRMESRSARRNNVIVQLALFSTAFFCR
jgi:hypothetical protein